MKRLLVVFMIIIFVTMMLGNGCEKRVNEELEINEPENTSVESQNTDAVVEDLPDSKTDGEEVDTCDAFPIINTPTNMDMSYSCSNNGNQVYWKLQIRGDSYCYDAYQEPSGDHAMFYYNLNGDNRYQVLIKDESDNMYDETGLPDFYKQYLSIWGFQDGIPNDCVSFSPLPILPDECWTIRENDDPAYMYYIFAGNPIMGLDCNMKVEIDTGLMKTNSMLFEDYQVFVGRSEYYEDYSIPIINPPDGFVTVTDPSGYEFLRIPMERLKTESVTDESTIKSENKLPEVNIPRQYWRKGTGIVNGNMMEWKFSYDDGDYMLIGRRIGGTDEAIYTYDAENDSYSAAIKDIVHGDIYTEANLMNQFFDRFYSVWGFDDERPAEYITFSPIPSILTNVMIWTYEEDELDTSNWMLTVKQDETVKGSCKIDHETGMMNSYNIDSLKYDIEIQMTEEMPVLNDQMKTLMESLEQTHSNPYDYPFVTISPEFLNSHEE